MDLGFKRLQFTWSNKRLSEANVKEHLDGAICNGAWCDICLSAQDDGYAQATIAYLLWYIWKSRCCELYEHKEPHFSRAIRSTTKAINDLWTVKGVGNFANKREKDWLSMLVLEGVKQIRLSLLNQRLFLKL